MIILINTLGIQDSGGIRVLEKLLNECVENTEYEYYVYANSNTNINMLIKKYLHIERFHFFTIDKGGFLYRLYFENIKFNTIVKEQNINLIYNFSGTSQLFIRTPQITKIQNLLFYTKTLDNVYKSKGQYVSWFKQIYLKRLVFRYMSNKSRYLEIQSSHVKEYMSDFIRTADKTFFIKSDINVEDKEFKSQQKYDFSKKVKFLYIVGPHFEYLHKNFRDFTDVILKFKKLNIDFEINITLSKEQLNNSVLWDSSLDEKTNFIGYISNQKDMDKLFCENTILISTSIIETLGLHVVEAIKKGVIPIAPNENYSNAVYGENIITYELFNTKSLLNSILSIIESKIDCESNILILQNDLKSSENNKYRSVVDIFQNILKNRR